MNLNEQIKKLITKQKTCKFTVLGLNLLFTRMMSQYERNLNDEQLEKCTKEVSDYILKYERVLKNDIEKLKEV